jgi:hypothetical protein
MTAAAAGLRHVFKLFTFTGNAHCIAVVMDLLKPDGVTNK